MSDNTGRVLTLVIRITKPDEAAWIWKNLATFPSQTDHGIQIVACGEGNQMEPNKPKDQND